jgi:hypothetical protein
MGINALKVQDFHKYGFCLEGKAYVISHLRTCEGCRRGLTTLVNEILSEIPMLGFILKKAIPRGETLQTILEDFLNKPNEVVYEPEKSERA